jgi:pyridoxal phosphate enzyme (YggS family)
VSATGAVGAADAERRRAEIAEGLQRVEDRIAAACSAAGRSPDEVTLVVVTKYFPVADLRHLASLGVRHVGENRYQEAVAKREECADLDLTWHFLGRLQSNKAAAVGAWADVVQSLDRRKLVAPLARGATREPGEVDEAAAELDVLVQVNLDDDPAEAARRGGAAPDDVPALTEAVLEASGLRLRGVMAVAPREEEPRSAFQRLHEIAARVQADSPGATWISAGMSNDLEDAITCGATHVRVGGAILGNRPPNG